MLSSSPAKYTRGEIKCFLREWLPINLIPSPIYNRSCLRKLSIPCEEREPNRGVTAPRSNREIEFLRRLVSAAGPNENTLQVTDNIRGSVIRRQDGGRNEEIEGVKMERDECKEWKKG